MCSTDCDGDKNWWVSFVLSNPGKQSLISEHKKFLTHFISYKHKYIVKLKPGSEKSASEKSQDLNSQLCTELILSYLYVSFLVPSILAGI